jgi:hypothetical protein
MRDEGDYAAIIDKPSNDEATVADIVKKREKSGREVMKLSVLQVQQIFLSDARSN